MQDDVFEGISAVFPVPDGITFNGNSADLSAVDLLEFPVSDDSGFNFDTGQPSIEHFKVKGLQADWVNTFTPGDGEITLEIPCNNTNILELVYGQTGTSVTITLPTGVTAKNVGTGKGFSTAQKAVYLGMLVLNDTEDKLLFIKKAKFMAQTIFDGSNKPLCVVLTGSIASAGANSFGILTLAGNS
jgi:hypothetical protein